MEQKLARLEFNKAQFDARNSSILSSLWKTVCVRLGGNEREVGRHREREAIRQSSQVQYTSRTFYFMRNFILLRISSQTN